MTKQTEWERTREHKIVWTLTNKYNMRAGMEFTGGKLMSPTKYHMWIWMWSPDETWSKPALYFPFHYENTIIEGEIL